MSYLALVLVLLAVAHLATSELPPDGSSLSDYVAQLNRRAQKLYNARLWNQMVNELYTENAILSVPQYKAKGKGRKQIMGLLKKTGYGKIINQQVIMAWTYGPVINARVIMDFRMLTHPDYKPGTIIRWYFDETIIDGQFIFMEKDTGRDHGSTVTE